MFLAADTMVSLSPSVHVGFLSVWRYVVVGRVDISEEHVASIHLTHFSLEDGSNMFLIIVGNTASFRHYI